MKKNILHIIDDLGRGGAEIVLATTVKQLAEFNNIIVTLYPKNEFGNELKFDKYYCLNLKSFLLLPTVITKFKKIIKENNVDIVHSHLFWSTVLCRLAVPRKIPLITTIHAFIASSLEYKYFHIRYVDKLTYRLRKNIIIAVAEGARQEYFNFLKLEPYRSYALYTFVDTNQFDHNKHIGKTKPEGICKLISVGNLRQQKNQMFLLHAFKELNKNDYQLDIYGEGILRNKLESFIKENDINVNLKGTVSNLPTLINDYDLFVMASHYEGFSLGVLEAMAMQMPLLLSDISSFREQCEDSATYFSENNIEDFVAKLKKLTADKNEMKLKGEQAYKRVMENFTLQHHMAGLRNIYQETLQSK